MKLIKDEHRKDCYRLCLNSEEEFNFFWNWYLLCAPELQLVETANSSSLAKLFWKHIYKTSGCISIYDYEYSLVKQCVDLFEEE